MTTKKQTYHHGDLRQALIDAALQQLSEEGIEKLSLRSIARRAGVSQAAPYSHFKDKKALLVEAAAYGFSQFREALEKPEALNDTLEAKREKLDALGVVYVKFALQNKPLFQLMFGDALSGFPKSENYRVEGMRAYHCIAEAVQDVTDDADAPLAAWTMVHGLATLMVDAKVAPVGDLTAQVGAITRFLKF